MIPMTISMVKTENLNYQVLGKNSVQIKTHQFILKNKLVGFQLFYREITSPTPYN